MQVLWLFFVAAAAAIEWELVHTTDIHGWIGGHPHNQSLSADLGDTASLFQHLRAKAAAEGREFLLIDSGDLVEGTGYSDVTKPDGSYVLEAMKLVGQYDVLTIGNHDLEYKDTLELFRTFFIPSWKGKYVSSNSFWKSDNSTVGVPYRVLQTPLGHSVLFFGFMYNFTQTASTVDVVDVEIILEQPWVRNIVEAQSFDLIVVAAHIDPQTPPDLEIVWTTLRRWVPTTPVAIMAGHRHVLYWNQPDNGTLVMESGRYLEAVGRVRFQTYPDSKTMWNVKHEFLPASLDTYYQVSGQKASNFSTFRGQNVKSYVENVASKLDLKKVYGCCPMYLDPYVPMTNNASLFGLFVESVVPSMIFSPAPLGEDNFFVTNLFALRYPIFKGQFTKNDLYTTAPFKDLFFHIRGLQGTQLAQLLELLSQGFNDEKWAWSQTPVDHGSTYNLVGMQYDIVDMVFALQSLFPHETFTAEKYECLYTSTSVWEAYAKSKWPC